MQQPVTPTRRRSRWLVLCLTIPIFAVALFMSRGSNSDKQDPPPDSTKAPALRGSTVTVAPGLHCLGSLDPAAVYVVEIPDGLVLVDSGFEPDARSLKQE